MTNVLMRTSAGDITIELYTDSMPVTAGNFLKLVEKGYYNGLHFHRVIKGFMLQGGCPHSKDPNSNRCGTGGPGYTISDEHLDDAKFSNEIGTLSMANAGPNSGGSQFFINTEDNRGLDFQSETEQGWGYCVFGKVTDGIEVVIAIDEKPTTTRNGHEDVPEENVTIDKVTLLD